MLKQRAGEETSNLRPGLNHLFHRLIELNANYNQVSQIKHEPGEMDMDGNPTVVEMPLG